MRKHFAFFATGLMILMAVAMSGCVEEGTFIADGPNQAGLYLTVPVKIKVTGKDFKKDVKTGEKRKVGNQEFEILKTQTTYVIETSVGDVLKDSSGNANPTVVTNSFYQTSIAPDTDETIYSYNNIAVNTDKQRGEGTKSQISSDTVRDISGDSYTEITFDEDSILESSSLLGVDPDTYVSSLIGGGELKGVASAHSPGQRKWTETDMQSIVSGGEILLPAWVGIHIVINSRAAGSIWEGDFKVPFIVTAPGPGTSFDQRNYEYTIFVFTPFAKLRRTRNIEVAVFGMKAQITAGFQHLASKNLVVKAATWLGIGLVIAGALLIAAGILAPNAAALAVGIMAVGAGIGVLWLAKTWDNLDVDAIEKAKLPFWIPTTPEKFDGEEWLYKVHE